MDARTFFRTGVNFMTPNKLHFIDTEDYYIEISSGKFINGTIYGLTVHNRIDGTQNKATQKIESVEHGFEIIKELTAKKND